MGLKWLDLMEFLKPQTSCICDLGAAAVGIITPNQTINVMTSNDGRGMHSDAKNIILNNVFDLKYVDNSLEVKDILNSVITLNYSNVVINGKIIRFVAVTIPKSVSWYQYQTLCWISKEFDEIRKHYDFMVLAQIEGYDYKSDKTINNLKELLPEVARRVSYSEYSDEKLATVDEHDRFTVQNCVVKSM